MRSKCPTVPAVDRSGVGKGREISSWLKSSRCLFFSFFPGGLVCTCFRRIMGGGDITPPSSVMSDSFQETEKRIVVRHVILKQEGMVGSRGWGTIVPLIHEKK